jgi:uncharacterized damage-inducible protein DinB
MNEVLLDAFRHNSWATRHLLAVCRGLSAEQLAAAESDGSRSIIATFTHIIMSDAAYLRSLAGDGPAWQVKPGESADLDQLQALAEETEQNWERLLAQPLDAERLIILDKGTYEAHAGILIAQALHHGNAHREQICAILTGLGVEPPGIQPWEYADATGRGRKRSTNQ